MVKKTTVDVVIVTKDRPEKLFRATASLLANDDTPTRIIIIDSSQKKAFPFRTYLASLCEKIKVDLIYKSISTPGISLQRNMGIELAKSDILVFLDDDEVVPQNWIQTIKKVFNEDSKRMVITGIRKPYYPHNFWNQVWKQILSFEKTPRGYRNFMISSNTAYRLEFFHTYKLRFENKIKVASDDVFLSYKILETGNRIFFEPELIIYHDFRTNLKSFLKQWYGYGYSTFQAHYYYLAKGKIRFSNIPVLYKALNSSMIWAINLRNKNSRIFLGLILRDISFSLGYFASFCVSLI